LARSRPCWTPSGPDPPPRPASDGPPAASGTSPAVRSRPGILPPTRARGPGTRPDTGPARPRTKGTAIARIDDLMDTVDSKFHLVHLAAKRAREINEYYGQLGEGLGQHVPPLVVTDSNKPLSIALEEIAEGKIV